MPATRFVATFILLALFGVSALAQSAQRMAPLPGDPLEMATGTTMVIDTPQKRLPILKLLQRARQNSALHMPDGAPYTLRASFNSSGQSRFVGPGELEEAWASGQSWRWSAHLGGFSQSRIFYKHAAYDANPATPMPMRLKMVRSAIFSPLPMSFEAGLMRIASAKWNGNDLMCILLSSVMNDPTPTPGRRWVETEYCLDPKTALLQIWSEAPGIYVVYDYNGATQFHGRTLPKQISIIEGGNPVLEIQIEGIHDGAGNPALLVPIPQMTAQMIEDGPGAIMSKPFRFPQAGGGTPEVAEGTVQPIIVHAIIDEKGKVVEAEALPTVNASLNNSALQLVEKTVYPPQRGLMPTEREAFINVRYESNH
jgi:hypothetical protein